MCEGDRADRDAARRDDGRLARTQSDLRHAHLRDQRQRAVADRGLADADEQVAGAQIEAALEHGRDLGAGRDLAEFRRHHTRAQDRDDESRAIDGRARGVSWLALSDRHDGRSRPPRRSNPRRSRRPRRASAPARRAAAGRRRCRSPTRSPAGRRCGCPEHRPDGRPDPDARRSRARRRAGSRRPRGRQAPRRSAARGSPARSSDADARA